MFFRVVGGSASPGEAPVMLAEQDRTTATTPSVPRKRREVVPTFQSVPATTTTGASCFLPTRSTALPERSNSSSFQGESRNSVVDVTMSSRTVSSLKVRQKFEDIFNVSLADCLIFESKILNSFSDERNVAGRLSFPASVAFFKSVGAPQFILDSLQYGHHSVFTAEVPRLERKNNASFYKHELWAVAEVKKLFSLDKVELVKVKPFCVLPLHVVVQPKKNRLVLDCGLLNKYIVIPKFKLDDYKVALNFFRSRGWLITFDMKDGYHHIAIHPEFRKYLGFTLVLEGKQVYGQFKVGLLGLADMPWLFTKIFRVLVKHWRSVGMQCCLYLDDGWHCEDDYEVALKYSDHVRSDLEKAGVVCSSKKSHWSPSREVEWLGMIWNADSLTLKISERRIVKLKGFITVLLSRSRISIRQLASFVGQVISLSPVIGNLSRLRSRFSQILVAQSSSYEERIVLGDEVVQELKFWHDEVSGLNHRCCIIPDPPISVSVLGDASATGCGSFIKDLGVVAARHFTEEERAAHSTWRELENVHFSLKAFSRFLHNKVVKFHVDNKSSVSIIQSGSMKRDCHLLALGIADFCARQNIVLSMQWIPREKNQVADEISRLSDVIDTDDWSLSDDFFHQLDREWGPCSIDCFANFYNFKVSRFYSLFWVPGSAGVDAFSFNWQSETCLLVPPVALIGRTLEHLWRCKARGILVVPLWPSSFFWPLLKGFFRKFIADVCVGKGSEVLSHGRNTNSLLGSRDLASDVIALLIDCNLYR